MTLANPVDGLLLTNTVWPVFFGGVNALVANGFTVPSTASTNSPQNFIATQQPYLWNRLAEVRSVQAILSPASGSTVTASNVTLTGVAPVEVRGFKLNGIVVANLIWTTVTNWSLSVPLASGSNFFQLTGYDRKTNALPVRDVGGYTNSIHVFH